MFLSIKVLSASLMALAVAASQAQGAASAPDTAPPQGTHNGMHKGMQQGRMHTHRGNTGGWAMMTRAERDQHHRAMMGMKNYEECSSYMASHHAQMTERAKARGRSAPALPKQDACAPLRR